MNKHFLDTVVWPVLPIINYKGAVVVKTVAGYTVLKQNVSTPQEVDKIIDEANLSIKKSLK